MGQQISSSKLSSLFAWTPANQTPVDQNTANSTLADCRCPLDILSEDSDAVECARCKPTPSRNIIKQNCEITSSLSSTAINNNNISSNIPGSNNVSSLKNGNSRTFNSFSCFRSSHNSGSFDHTDESEDMRCKIDNINTASCSYRMKNDKKNYTCHRNNDTMSGQDCDDGTSTECLSCESSSENCHPKCSCGNRDVCDMPRNLSNDSGLSNPSRSCAIDNNQEDNGNATGRISQSPNIDRYMNALTDLTEQNSICNNVTCDWGGNGNSEGNSVKKNHTQRCRGSSKVNSKQNRQHEMSKGCSKQHDLSAAEESLKEVGCKNSFVKKKQRWVPKFGISKSINKTGKSSISAGHRSVDSGLEVAGSTNDNLCVCTSHRTVDEVVSSPPHHNLTLGFARDRDNWVRAPSVSIESNVTYHNSGRHQTHYSSRVSYQAISGDHGIELNQEQQHSFNIPSNLANLPINIMLTRMPLGSSGGVYGPLHMSNTGAVYSTMQNNSGGVYGNSGGVYGNAGDVYGALLSEDTNNGSRSGIGGEGNVILLSVGAQNAPVIDLSRLTAEDFPLEDCEEQARERRAIEIAEGVEPPPGYRSHIQMVSPIELRALLFHQQQQQLFVANNILQTRIHTQVDYIHCLVPDLRAITSCSFYWGKMDRYEAERLLEGKPEGTFLLRDSAQEEYLFSVSFRKYGRSLHARIEQFNHKFSFDSHDPGVYAANTVTGLIEHYKDPACVMFFEPMLTAPLSRTHAFPLQHLCRAAIASTTTYDGISELRLPPTMKAYLKEYHYRQRVRIKRFEGHPEGFHWDPEENQYRENN